MRWQDLLMKKCYETVYRGGEVRIQFSKRDRTVVPIIRTYPENQTICDEVKIED